MEKIILQNKFCTYYFDDKTTFLIQLWTNETGEMEEEDYKNEMLNYLNFVKIYSAITVLIDLKQFNFPIDPKVQIWVDINIAVYANKIVKKIAFVLPQDIIVELSIDQVMTEKEGQNYKALNYFNNQETAKEWLLD